jgi:DNA-binding MarR family transcriptional regulator
MPILNRDKRNVGLRSMAFGTEFLPYLACLMMSEPFTHLTARQIAIFFCCSMQPEPQSVRALSRYLKVSRPSVSLALRRLERLGLLRRMIDPTDRRGVIAEPTDIGREHAKCWEMVRRHLTDRDHR